MYLIIFIFLLPKEDLLTTTVVSHPHKYFIFPTTPNAPFITTKWKLLSLISLSNTTQRSTAHNSPRLIDRRSGQIQIRYTSYVRYHIVRPSVVLFCLFLSEYGKSLQKEDKWTNHCAYPWAYQSSNYSTFFLLSFEIFSTLQEFFEGIYNLWFLYRNLFAHHGKRVGE